MRATSLMLSDLMITSLHYPRLYPGREITLMLSFKVPQQTSQTIELQKNLYGDPGQQNFDGIHLLGPDGRNHFTRSVCNILQSVMVSHSREPHFHVIPKTTPRPCPIPLAPASPSIRSPVTSNLQARKPDHFVIDIESENINHEECNLYTIPVSNSFSVLGNWM